MSEQNGSSRGGYLLFAWSPTGYSVSEREGEPPQAGDEIEEAGRALVISKVGASPFPADPRICVYSMGRS